jgi:hypothetical protein
MSHIIYKYGPFNINGEMLEFEGEPVHVGYQDRGFAHADYAVFIWCKLDMNYPIHTRKYARIVPTGESFNGKYIGTVVMPSGLVWHVVEV